MRERGRLDWGRPFCASRTRSKSNTRDVPSDLSPRDQATVDADPTVLHCEDNGGTLQIYDDAIACDYGTAVGMVRR